MKNIANIIFTILLVGYCVQAKDERTVNCTTETMHIRINLPVDAESTPSIYLNGLKGFPNEQCQPKVSKGLAEFKLSLKNFYDCGLTRIVNNISGKTVFYHKVIVEEENNRETISVKCIIRLFNGNQTNHHQITRRDLLPVGFQEPEDLEITTSLTEKAPEPVLNVNVLQGNSIVSGELNVSPGTPLVMQIYLDEKSSPIYGLGVTYMQVTDTRSQEETIVFNGCSVDPYLFDNFNTVDGDLLSAKFRAFKFPESTYVQFRGTVNVCLDRCIGIPCSNGQIGYGRRRRREIATQQTDPNKIYEISMATFIKVQVPDNGTYDHALESELENRLLQLKESNKRYARNSRGQNNVFESVQDHRNHQEQTVQDAVVQETTSPKPSSASINLASGFIITFVLSFRRIFY